MKEVMKAGEHIGHYVVERRVGQGSMGDVYLAHPEGADHFKVAIKLFNAKGCLDLDDAEKSQRWEVECDAMRRVSHPNVVGILHPGRHNDSRYISMDYVPGPTLTDVIRQKPLTVHKGVSLALRMSNGIAALHNANIIHRDLKPSNVIVSQRENPVIIDFGISILQDRKGKRITTSGMILGTPGYVPPEIIEGDLPGKPADIYALGIMTLQMLGGKVNRYDPRLALLQGNREHLFKVDVESVVQANGPEYQYLTSIIEPMVHRHSRNRATASEAQELLKWGLRRTRHTETRKFTRPVPATPLSSLLEDAVTLSKNEFLDIHADVNGVLVSPHCYARLDNPLLDSSNCGCSSYIVSGLQEQELVLGRQADVCIPVDKISRRHARLIVSNLKPMGTRQYRVLVQDLNSTNGTYVNGTLLKEKARQLLQSDDVIDLGHIAQLRFTYPADLYDRLSRASSRTDLHRRSDFA